VGIVKKFKKIEEKDYKIMINSAEKRLRVDGREIGCPASHGEAPCPRCGGNWPGTRSPSSKIIDRAKRKTIKSGDMGCGVLEEQVEFLIRYFSQEPSQVE